MGWSPRFREALADAVRNPEPALMAIVGASQYQPSKPWWLSKFIWHGIAWLLVSGVFTLQWLGLVSGLDVVLSTGGVALLSGYVGGSKIVLRIVTDRAVTWRKRWK